MTPQEIEEIIKDPNRMLPQLEKLLNARDSSGTQLRILPELMKDPKFAGMIEYIIRDYYNDLRDERARIAMQNQVEEDRKLIGKHTKLTAQQYIKSFEQNYDSGTVAMIYQRSSSWHDRKVNEYEEKRHNAKLLREAFNL